MPGSLSQQDSHGSNSNKSCDKLSNLAKSKRKNEWLLQKLRDCHSSPILQVENCTAADFMDWLQSVRDKNKEGNNFLDKSSYGNRIDAPSLKKGFTEEH